MFAALLELAGALAIGCSMFAGVMGTIWALCTF